MTDMENPHPTSYPQSTPTPRGRRRGSAVALVASGLLAGGILAGTISANAQTDAGAGADSTTAGEGKSGNHGETLLEGDVATQVEAAVLAAYPGATIHRLETDSDGTYEAHILTADGARITVEVDESFAVTGEEEHGPGDRGRGHGGRGSGETLLEGDTATQVEAAVLAEYPDATVVRLETDSDGVYEAHITDADGQHLIVAVDESFTVTDSVIAPEMGQRGGHGPRGGPRADDSTDEAPTDDATAETSGSTA